MVVEFSIRVSKEIRHLICNSGSTSQCAASLQITRFTPPKFPYALSSSFHFPETGILNFFSSQIDSQIFRADLGLDWGLGWRSRSRAEEKPAAAVGMTVGEEAPLCRT